ncbi:molybdenum cofactor guanylyltransferase MobA [Hydrogenimonas sp.]|uniref:molybdenum cofactor guanylyltransferase MobA n=1 Tax=Hydrogenimonas sp. TaxID=2231112 RepID=UPI002607A58C|nr:molybdenum cofactor guanylyltransferase MobA [Hydrogenimonas sp.]
MKFPLPCVIFAGGKSSRMGQDKALLPFGGFPSLAEYQYRRLLPLFSNVYISAKRNKFSFDAPMILDAPASDFFAPTAGLLTVYETLASDFFAISVDTPFVDETVIEGVVSLYEREKADAVIARSPGGTHPMCGIYTMTLLPLLKQMIEEGNHRLNHLLGIADTRFVDFPDDELFFNMNTPAEYRAGNRKS